MHLRIVHGAKAAYFYINYAGDMTVISAAGLPLRRTRQDRVLMAIAETYDVLVKLPEHGMAEFRATSQNGSGMASYWLGQGEKTSHPSDSQAQRREIKEMMWLIEDIKKMARPPRLPQRRSVPSQNIKGQYRVKNWAIFI